MVQAGQIAPFSQVIKAEHMHDSGASIRFRDMQRDIGVYPVYPRLGLFLVGAAGILAVGDCLIKAGLLSPTLWTVPVSILSVAVGLLTLAVPFFGIYLRAALLIFYGLLIIGIDLSLTGFPLSMDHLSARILALTMLALLLVFDRKSFSTMSFFRVQIASSALAFFGIGIFFLYPQLDYVSHQAVGLLGLSSLVFALVFLADIPLRLAGIVGLGVFLSSGLIIMNTLNLSYTSYYMIQFQAVQPFWLTLGHYLVSFGLFLAVAMKSRHYP